MRIAFLAPDMSGTSGWSRYAVDLATALHKLGHEIHVLCAAPTNDSLFTEHVCVRPPTSYLGSTLLCQIDGWNIRRILERIQPDIVHIIAEPYALLFPFHKGKWKTYLTIHGSYAIVPLISKASIKRRAERYYHDVDSIISVSEYTKSYLKSRAPELFEKENLQNRIQVIHNAITLKNISAVSDHTPQSPFKIISVSAVKKKKGYIQSLNALKYFCEHTGKDIRYDIYGSTDGDPLFTEELGNYAQTIGMQEKIHLHGRVSDDVLDEAYRSADLFLLPSLHEGDYFEGFGLVFLEANARGVPVIGPTTGGCPEAIADGKSGYICEPEDAAQIGQRMEDILIHQKIHRSDCRAWAEEHDCMNAAKTVEAFYRK